MAKRHLNLHTMEGHSYVRANERLPVGGRIYFSSDENEGTGTVQDVSVGGWRVRTDHTHVKLGDDVTFFATLPDHQQPVLVDQARVCWSRGDEFGLAIGKITTQDAKRLKGFISAHH